ncbi:hypothetical protein J4Q44_G00305720 [Coregonus suidteri]|uniref:Cyclin-A2 n=1 Tax=Coregonus suidteri TaxID=861788 RepID=A0AAN8QRE7_9TELE
MSGSNQGQGIAVDVPLPEYQNQENMLSRLRGPIKNRVDNQENIVPKAPQRTVLGGLQNNQCSKPQTRGTKQVLSCENEVPKSYAEKLGTKQPAFQIHLDEPDAAFSRKRVSLKAKPSTEISPLKLNPTVTCLRQPLASLDIPVTCLSNMDGSFGDCPMDMSVIEGEEKPVDMNAATEYASEIHAYLREMEVKSRPKAGYMKKQPDITYSMRAILVDWLVEVGEEYKLQNETLYLAVNYIDRFLSSMSVLRGKLQLVGTAAMLLASKFEEIYPPEVAEFVYITDDTYTKKQVLRMEHLVLKVLSFDLASPTINQFLTQYFLTQPVSNKVESLSMFLGELSLVDSDPFLKYLPSQTAAAAFILANHTITGGSWSKSLAEVTGNSLEDLMPCIEDLYQMYLNAATHAQQSVREKYKGAKYEEVSLIEPPTKLSLK